MGYRQVWFETNGVRLHAVTAGPEDGPLVLLLHGFPDFWYGWRHQVAALAAAGYRVVAPDQRGYNLSEKPRGLAAYRIDRLAADVVGLIAACGRDTATVVGHDWGGGVAWWVALQHPSWLDRLVIINAPHPTVMIANLLRNPRQLLKSQYIFFFQLPWLPERLIRAGNWWLAERALRLSSRPGVFTAADLAHYRAAWSQPGAMTAMLNWYRAAARWPGRLANDRRVPVPTLLIWGAQDEALVRELAQESVDLCTRGQLRLFDEATHWVQHEEPERVNGLLIDFLNS